ncbi:MAG TPA: thioredoxin family protein [Dongiaceae bacterium]|jgi:protein disulfide-isomerase|nr:thioredoxin family protein [Dongiaceae bacterium]
MKRLILATLAGVAILAGCSLHASYGPEGESTWLTDLPQAQAQAKAEHKMVLLDFTGSDWCPWCIRLHKEIFSRQAFADYAKTNLVLVEVDFPHNKPQNDALKKANQALADRFQIEGYPTVIVLNADGKQVGQLGYQSGGPQPFIAELEKLKKKGA